MKKSNVTPLVPKGEKKDNETYISSLSPREIVSELDRFVIGQNKAKRAVAIALAGAEAWAETQSRSHAASPLSPCTQRRERRC